jgi:hypothetical protein
MGKTPPMTPKIALNKIIGKIEAPMMKYQSYILTIIIDTFKEEGYPEPIF